jgi:hypothetical protein
MKSTKEMIEQVRYIIESYGLSRVQSEERARNIVQAFYGSEFISATDIYMMLSPNSVHNGIAQATSRLVASHELSCIWNGRDARW